MLLNKKCNSEAAGRFIFIKFHKIICHDILMKRYVYKKYNTESAYIFLTFHQIIHKQKKNIQNAMIYIIKKSNKSTLTMYW